MHTFNVLDPFNYLDIFDIGKVCFASNFVSYKTRLFMYCEVPKLQLTKMQDQDHILQNYMLQIKLNELYNFRGKTLGQVINKLFIIKKINIKKEIVQTYIKMQYQLQG